MLVQTREQFDSVVDCLRYVDRVAVDTETNGLKVYKGHRIAGVAVYFKVKSPYTLAAYFPFRHQPGDTLFNLSHNLPLEWLKELGDVLGRSDLRTDWHNFKFDAGMFMVEGVQILGEVHDSMVKSTMLNENWSHKMEALEYRFLGTSTKKALSEMKLKPYLKGKKDYSRVPPAEMEAYATNDVRVTYLLNDILDSELEAHEMGHLWTGQEFSDLEFLRCLFDMEWSGVLVDRRLAEQLSGEAEARMRQLEDDMGFDPQKRAVLADRLFLQPPAGLGLPEPAQVTLDTSPNFPQGIPVMDEAALSVYDHPLVGKVLEYRGLVKANSTWYAGFLRHMDASDRIHPIYNTGGEREKYGTRTGRLTAAEPNIQQLPRDPTVFVRKLIKAPDGFILVEFDYNQIEYRLAGPYSDETTIIEAYKNGSDMHQLTADKLGIPRVDPKGGVDGKKINFTILYGGGPQRIAETFGGSLAEGKVIYNDFWKEYPHLRAFIQRCEEAARRQGFVRLWDGHKRHFEHEYDYHKAFNSVIQGGAAKIVQRSMLKIYKSGLKGSRPPYEMKYQVHDALGFYIPEDCFDESVADIKIQMEWATDYFELEFPVDFKIIHEKVTV